MAGSVRRRPPAWPARSRGRPPPCCRARRGRRAAHQRVVGVGGDRGVGDDLVDGAVPLASRCSISAWRSSPSPASARSDRASGRSPRASPGASASPPQPPVAVTAARRPADGARSGPGRELCTPTGCACRRVEATPADSVRDRPQRLLDLLGSAPGRRLRPGAPDQGLGRRPGTVRRRPRTARYRRANHSCHGASARRRVTWWFGADPDQSAPIPRAQRPRRPVVSWAVHPIDGGFRFAPPTARRRLVPRPRLLALLRAVLPARWPWWRRPGPQDDPATHAEADATRDRIDLWLSCTSDDEAASSLTDGLCHRRRRPAAVARGGGRRGRRPGTAPAQVAIVDDVHLVALSSGAAGRARRSPARNGHVVLAGRTPAGPARPADVRARSRVGEADLSSHRTSWPTSRHGRALDQVAAAAAGRPWPAVGARGAHRR